MKKHFKKRFFLLVIMVLSFFGSQAQNKNSPDGFINNGGTLLIQETSLMASVGEPIVGLSSEGSFHCLQGFVYKIIPEDYKTSIDDYNLDNLLEINVYPNPASAYLHLQLKSNVQEDLDYSIISLTGSKVQSGRLNGALTTIDLAGIISSPYILTVYNKGKGDILYKTLFIIKK